MHTGPTACAQGPYCLCTLVHVHPCSCASHMACSRHPSVWPQLFLQAQMISATVNALTFLHPTCIIGAHACIVSSECFCVCSFSAQKSWALGSDVEHGVSCVYEVCTASCLYVIEGASVGLAKAIHIYVYTMHMRCIYDVCTMYTWYLKQRNLHTYGHK